MLLLGGSGSGKTTFINAVIGYEKADARVLLNGADIYKDYDQVKYRIGLVPQQNLIRGSDTVDRTVDDAAKLRALYAERYPIYTAAADVTVPVRGAPEETANLILEKLQ